MSRPKRWAAAIREAQEASANLRSAMEDLQSVHEEYMEWKGNLPENFEFSPVGEKLEEIEAIEVEDGINALDEIDGTLELADQADLPLGFGRD